MLSPTTARRRWHHHLTYLILLVAGTAFLIATSLANHHALGTGYDLGIYDQVVWNMAHGRLFQTTLVYETNGYYDHLEPVLGLIAPIYWLLPDVRVLLVLQSLALGLGSLPLYLYACRQGAHLGRWRLPVATLLAAAYLAFPPLHSANLNDFHEVALMPPLVGFALYGLLRGRRRVLLTFMVLCLLVKEDFGVTALAIGLYILLLRPHGFGRRDGLWISVAVLAWVALVLSVLYPAMTHGMPYPFVDRRYSWLGETPVSALQVLLRQPWSILPHVLQPPKIVFLLRLFGPLLFLPLLGWPVIALAMPILVYLMMSDYPPQWSVQSYYNPPLMPFLFFGLIFAFRRLARWAGRLPGRWLHSLHSLRSLRSGQPQPVIGAATLIVMGAVVVSYYLYAPGPGSRSFSPAAFTVSPRGQAGYVLLAQVPPAAAVSTIWAFVPHLSQRQRIYTLLARPGDPPDYLLVEDSPEAQGAPLYPFAAPPGWPPVYHEYTPTATAGPYELLAHQRSLALVALPENAGARGPLRAAAYAWLDGASAGTAPPVSPGGVARLMLGWQRIGPLDRRYVFFVHLLDPQRAGADGGPVIVTQSGHEAGDGRYPTTFWETWTRPSVVLDEQRLEIPTGCRPGTYQVWAGIYDKESGERLELGGPGQTLVPVGPLTVAPPTGSQP